MQAASDELSAAEGDACLDVGHSLQGAVPFVNVVHQQQGHFGC